ncbi:MAG TPA: Ni/Fe hydrogenase subunit alpha [Chthonomonadales bacterium]|nr:Ni/Fe hydrogenase subunit alpha [Chthonomonadales bacterium]
MGQQIMIDPVTRIEGHAKITIQLDDSGQVNGARLHVVEFRGFEKFCEGRPLWEMPGITARICGICPVSHLLASAKTGDAIMAVGIPPAADKLRRLMNLAQITQSHALSFFHLSSPDLIFGMESDAAKRNVFGLIEADPALARAGIRLRQFGQEVIELLGGRKLHPAWPVPGGVRSPLTDEGRSWIGERLPEAFQTVRLAIDLLKRLSVGFARETEVYGNFPTLFMGLVTPDGRWEHYDGHIRFVDSAGAIVADKLNAAHYREYIGEAVEPWTYLKFPYYKPLGYPAGIYRVGPLARLNVCSHVGTPLADAELAELRQMGGRIATSSFLYHYARLVEIVAALEATQILIDDPDVLSTRCRASAGINSLHGVGCSEAPRGTLFHDYHVDEYGMVEKMNLVIATGQNNLAMNRTIEQIARSYISGPAIPEGVLNRIEHGIRCYDPCLSCSTHAAGRMPMMVQLVGPDGGLLDEVRRG